MNFLKKVLFYFVVIAAMVIFFAPKKALYYQAEKALAEQQVVLSGERADDSGFALSLEGGTLYYQDLKVAKLNDITFWPFLLVNRISVAPFTFSPDMQSMLPGMISELYVQYSLFDPLHIRLEGEGDFGTVTGSINLLKRSVTVDLTASEKLLAAKAFWLNQMHKTEGGVYRYESTY